MGPVYFFLILRVRHEVRAHVRDGTHLHPFSHPLASSQLDGVVRAIQSADLVPTLNRA